MIIFITGVTAGFGEAIIRKFIANGHHVIGTGQRETRLKNCISSWVNIFTLSYYIMDKQAIKDAIKNLPENLNKIDVLVNNAELALDLDTAEVANTDDWDIMIYRISPYGLCNITSNGGR